jgi:Na+/proline symporter/signal transduction histidine kinase
MPGTIAASFAYLFLLFAIAWFGDRSADRGRSLIDNPAIYALSLGVYCTTWTFYGSVGRAASLGIGFLPIYLGPTLMMTLGFLLLRKVLRIARRHRITSIADFIAARYGRSQGLAAFVTVIAVIGITPYVALQLKAVSVSFDLLSGAPPGAGAYGVLADKAFYVALLMAAFAIIFGTRSIDAAEHHEGLVAAVAFESVVKLLAFTAAGAAIVWGMHDGLHDLFGRAAADPAIRPLLGAAPVLADWGWVTNTLLAMFAILLLPRQFQMLVVENKRERHLDRALWMFPLYLLLINLFVLPVAIAGLLRYPAGTIDPDMVVLALPLDQGWDTLALLVFLGGLSAATGMIVVEAVALSTMVSNDIVVPLLLRRHLATEGSDLSRLLLAVRRLAILCVLLLGYAYYRFAGSAYALVAIGLISFAAVAQFAPALVGGLFWTGASRRGAIAGLAGGVTLWAYTLLLPSFARSGWLPSSFIEDGPWGIGLLRPYALFGMETLDPLSHALFWSMLCNIGLFIAVSVLDRRQDSGRAQAEAFGEDLPPPAPGQVPAELRPGSGAGTGEVLALLRRFIGTERADAAFARFSAQHRLPADPAGHADPALLRFAERLLAGAVGAASARVALGSLARERGIGTDELLRMLDETSQVIGYSRQLEQKSAELERISAELRTANAKLLELDRLKDEFLSTVTHELRTPLTSIRAFAEILHDDPDIDLEQRREFLAVIVKESERLTRLINQVLDMAKIKAGQMDWNIGPVDLAETAREATSTTAQVFKDRGVGLRLVPGGTLPPARGDRDRIVQVLLNLLSNAVKFAPRETGQVSLSLEREGPDMLRVSVADNGPGIAAEDADIVFERFRQVGDTMTDRPQGTGLGLAICRGIVEHLGGRIWVETAPGAGTVFRFTLPVFPDPKEPSPSA